MTALHDADGLPDDIAALQARLDAAEARQAALAEVLATINANPGDVQPVFDKIVDAALALCGASFGGIVLYDGDLINRASLRGGPGNDRLVEIARQIGPDLATGGSQRMRQDRRPWQTPDLMETPGYKDRTRAFTVAMVEAGGIRAQLMAPLLKDDEVIGAIAVGATRPGPFSDDKVALLEAFAAQAVIAMENARLLGEQQAALERQTATAEVLAVINANPGNLAPVFTSLLEKAMLLCGAAVGELRTLDGAGFRQVASHGQPQAYVEYSLSRAGGFGPGIGPALLLAGEPVVHIPDLIDTDAYRRGDPDRLALVELCGARASLLVPLIRGGALAGFFMILRTRAGAFDDAQITLLQSFAAQAVIAIENARLLSEQQEALERQTATAEVLAVINANPGNLAPVFDAMLERAMRLCGVAFGLLYTWDGTTRRAVATRGLPVAFADHIAGQPETTDLAPLTVQLFESRKTLEIPDAADGVGYRAGHPWARALVELGGARTTLQIPLLKEDAVIGYVSLYRQEVRSFAAKEIALLESFAAQAVIAMENARLLGEQQEALERQTATAEVLQVINANPGNLAPVFDAMLERAMRLCGAAFGTLRAYDGEQSQTLATCGVPDAYAEYSTQQIAIAPSSPLAAALAAGRPYQALDITQGAMYQSGDPGLRALADLGGARTSLWVPLLKDDRSVGLFTIYRQEVRAFTDKQISLLESFAAQAVIAMDNARLLTEQQEALAQQTATAEVLQVINANPGNLAPVFDAILRAAHRVCGVAMGALMFCEGDTYRAVATLGYSREADALAREARPIPARVLAMGTGAPPLHDHDAADPRSAIQGSEFGRRFVAVSGFRTYLAVPLVKDHRTLGVISAARGEVRPFADREIALLESFAAQAVIAMDNARLLGEQQEALEQQKASADILTVISTSMGDVQPVFEKILESCQRLFGGDELDVLLVDEQGLLQVAAYVGRFRDQVLATFPAPVDITPAGSAIRERRVAHYADVMNNPDTPPVLRRIGAIAGYHSVAFAPMIWQDRGIGAIGVARAGGAFSERELAVLQSFAAQAVIAIQNTSLITEQAEALARQTATAEVLQVINANPGNLAPVFEIMLEKAMRLAGATFGILDVLDGDHYRSEATIGAPEAYLEFRKAAPMLAGDSATVTRFRQTGKPFHVLDLLETEGYRNGEVLLRGTYEFGGMRSFVGVPMMKNGAVLGIIWAFRQTVRSFTDRQIALIESFAAQAVIAMENARLLTEQQEALERQTATAEVLQVINANPGKLMPVFEAILEKAHHLCDARLGSLQILDGQQLRGVAMRGMSAALADHLRAGFAAPEAFLRGGGRATQVADLAAYSAENSANPAATPAQAELRGYRALLVPLHKDGVVLGRIVAARQAAGPFTDRQIALLENFAAQAVIAMDNARLLNEQREALERQTATAEVLQVINTNPGNLAPVFDAMLEKAMRLSGATCGLLDIADGPHFTVAAIRGGTAEYRAWRIAAGSLVVDPNDPFRSGGTLHILDPRETESYRRGSPKMRGYVDLGGNGTLLGVPLMKEGTLLGIMWVHRQEVRAFADKDIALVESFAAQAVIAIENARLLTEQQEALERQTATAEMLQVINSNPGDLTPVFDTMLDNAIKLSGAECGTLSVDDGGLSRLLAMKGLSPALSARVEALRAGTRFHAGHPGEQVMILRRPIQVSDVTAEPFPSRFPGTVELLNDLGGLRALLNVPLLKDDVAIGFIAIYRRAPGDFSHKQISLLESFAAQAVIAIENARLLSDLRARDEDNRRLIARQSASIDILKAISASPGDAQPVFDLIVRHVFELCDAAAVTVAEFDGTLVHYRAVVGFPPDGQARMRAAFPRPPGREFLPGRVVLEGGIVVIPDVQADMELLAPARAQGSRTAIGVPILGGGRVIGVISLIWFELRPRNDDEIALVQSFAEQAAIAIASATAQRALRARTSDLEQSLAYQTATSDVLKVISRSAFELQPVLDAVAEMSVRLCEADQCTLWLIEGNEIRYGTHYPVLDGGQERRERLNSRRLDPTSPTVGSRAAIERRVVQIEDVSTIPGYISAGLVEGQRTALGVPMLRDGEVQGMLVLSRRRVQLFTERQIELIRTFAAQAVIAMENARLLGVLRARTDELTQREDELRVTFENMGDGVAMFDAGHRLVAWNRKFQDILDLPDDVLAQGLGFADYIRMLAARGEFGPDADGEEHVQRLAAGLGQQRVFERLRPSGRTVEVRSNPVADGGFVLIYADITARKRAEAEIAAARDAAEQAARTIEAAYRELKIAQANLVQAEKMASLGQLTAGIAHEIKNPLNFVNNFSDLSVELLAELSDIIAPAIAALDDTARADAEDLAKTLTGNLQKITEHGRRADGIVRSMLEHSRGSSGERRSVDLNAVVEEALNLAYHGARAQNQSFNITLDRHYAPALAPITLTPQDITRVFLNLFSNGFYAANQRAKAGGEPGFAPRLAVSTRDLGDGIEIRVRDNGTGMSPSVREKLFEPFFTTKPTGEGTGLGLSISYDIVTKQHGGSIAVDSEPGAFTEFTVILPRQAMAA